MFKEIINGIKGLFIGGYMISVLYSIISLIGIALILLYSGDMADYKINKFMELTTKIFKIALPIGAISIAILLPIYR